MYDKIIITLILFCSVYECWILTREYHYDEQKDLEKKQRRTKTSKKTTKSADGSVVEEHTEETIGPAETKGE